MAIGFLTFACTVCAVIAAYWTLLQIERQTVSALLTAKQTKRSFEALINSERAWVLLQPVQETFHLGSRWDFAVMTMINNGRTAARIQAFDYEIVALELQALSCSPLTPEITTKSRLFEILPPGESKPIYVALPALNGVTRNSIVAGHTQLYCHGFILYLDAGDKQRTNRFCLQYTHDGRRMDGTPFFWRNAGPSKFIEHS